MDFDLIKNCIQKYTLTSLVSNILETLNVIQKGKNERHPYWKLLVLIKWSYLHTIDSNFRKKASPADIQHILSLIEQFEGEHILSFKNEKSVRKSLRIIAFQQFSYQDHFYNAIVDRQIILFTYPLTNLNLELEFKKLTGLSLMPFINYCYWTFIYLNLDKLKGNFGYDGKLHADYFNFFTRKFSKHELDGFLTLLTIIEPSHFENLHKLRDERLQLYETNFFITKPFLLFKKEFRLPHRAVFTQTIKHFLYNYLKTELPGFSDDFGKRLERYIELGLKENSLQYFTENDLSKQFKLTKVVDYKVGREILIECKAVELHPRSGILRSQNILATDLRSSIVKAYEQLLSTANAIDSEQEWFGIIITYKEMYLGFGTDAWDEFLQEPIEKIIYSNKLKISSLPPQNLFFISIEYWDYIMQVIKDGTATLKQILKKGRELNTGSNPVEKVFLIEQVLQKHFKIKNISLSYLQAANGSIDIIPDDGELMNSKLVIERET